jgi:hypothetical protein
MLGGMQIWKRDLVPRPVEIQGELFPDRIIPPKGNVGMEFPIDCDVLQVFWCPFYHPYDKSAHYLRWLSSGKVETARAANPPYRQPLGVEGMVPKMCRLHAEWYPDYPVLWEARELTGWSDLVRELQARLSFDTSYQENEDYEANECINEFYAENLGAVNGTKWGGYADWIQDPQVPSCECGTVMHHLLTVASSVNPTLGSFSVVVESRQSVSWDDELCMGDVGSVYYFMCPKCPGGTRYEAVFQCT